MRFLKRIVLVIAKPLGLLDFYHFLLAWLGSVLYGNPSKKLTVVGVTGTKGKSTTLELINAGLEAAGKKTVIVSSLRFKVGDESEENMTGNTMPGRGFIQKQMRKGIKAGCTHALIEVVSEGVAQHRHRFIDFNVAVFIGIHAEHIEAHGSFEKYREAKLKFFKDVVKSSRRNKIFVINKSDPSSSLFRRAAKGGKIVFYGSYRGPLKILGDFNRENAGAAEAVLQSLKIKEEYIRDGLGNFKGVPGRMDFVKESLFAVVVDYAHTPESLERVYRNLKTMRKDGELICVFGSAGGGRDKWKRPKLGDIASRYCREIILTDEDPFNEDPKKILEEIRMGILNDVPVEEILDRKKAIKKAVSLAKKGDTVVITGKGSEKYIRVAKGRRIPWSDKNVALEVLKKRK